MKDAKKFWKENKKKIILGTVAVTVGCVGGMVFIRNIKELNRYRKLFKQLDEFENHFLERLDEMQTGAVYATTSISPVDISVKDVGSYVQSGIDEILEYDCGLNPEMKLSGAVVFYK